MAGAGVQRAGHQTGEMLAPSRRALAGKGSRHSSRASASARRESVKKGRKAASRRRRVPATAIQTVRTILAAGSNHSVAVGQMPNGSPGCWVEGVCSQQPRRVSRLASVAPGIRPSNALNCVRFCAAGRPPRVSANPLGPVWLTILSMLHPLARARRLALGGTSPPPYR